MKCQHLEAAIQKIAGQLHKVMSELLPVAQGVYEDSLFEAMRYSVLSPGKRLRPFLTVSTANIFGVNIDYALQAAAAIEFIHAYSLIHDDLPAMDNDDYRRGQYSCHKKFNEAIAILAGNSLLTYAFEILADEAVHPDAVVRISLIKVIAEAVGFKGTIGGQALDISTQSQELDFSEIVRLQRMKTGALFAISCEAGAILGQAAGHTRCALKAYANNIGIAFQIRDDLLDADEETKSTLASCIGVEQAKKYATMLVMQAIEHLSGFDDKAKPLRELAYFIVSTLDSGNLHKAFK